MSVIVLLLTAAGAFAQQPVTTADLVGTWRSSCVERNGSSTLAQVEFDASGVVLKNTSHVHLGSGCSSPYFTAYGEFTLALQTDGLSATATPLVATLTFESVAAVFAANSGAGVCGLKDWVLNVPRPILGLPCSPSTPSTLGLSRVDDTTIQVTVCGSPNACVTTPYTKVN